MEFGWTREQDDLFAAARERGRAVLGGPPGAQRSGGGFDREAWRECAEFGLPGLCVPAEHGGLGLDLLTTARVIEGFGAGARELGLLFSASAHLLACCLPLARWAGEELRGRVLPPLARGESIGANAITEAEAGSDVYALRTTAVRDGDDYRLDGAKSFVTNAPVADAFVVYATTDAKAGYLGISAFLVERGAPGLTIGEPFAKTGLHAAPIASLYLDGCRVPAASRLGREGQGAAVFRHSMRAERACLFAAYVGAMERQLEEAIAYARERRQFGRPIARNQAVSHRIADMKLRLDGARLLLYRACWLLDSGRDAELEVSLAKLAVSEAAVESALDAIRIHGGAGVMAETGVAGPLADAVPSTIYSGTSDMQREIVARSLGL